MDIRLKTGQTLEGLGSEQKVFDCFYAKRSGWSEEIRTEEIPGRKVSFLIFKERLINGELKL